MLEERARVEDNFMGPPPVLVSTQSSEQRALTNSCACKSTCSGVDIFVVKIGCMNVVFC